MTGGERGRVDGVAVVLANCFRGKVTADDAELTARDVRLDPEAKLFDVVDQRRGVLAAAVGGEGEARAFLRKEAAVGAAIEVVRSLIADVRPPDRAVWHGRFERRGESTAGAVNGGGFEEGREGIPLDIVGTGGRCAWRGRGARRTTARPLGEL